MKLVIAISLLLLSFAPPCDNLKSDNSNYGYRQRDGRCEGLYLSEVTGQVIEIVSVTQGVLTYQMNSGEKLSLSTKKITGFDEVNIRGVNYSMNKNYRLDVVLPSGSEKMIPLGEVISPNKINPDNLGVFAFAMKKEKKYYLPVIPKSALLSYVKSPQKLQVKFISNTDLDEVKWRYSIMENGRCGKYVESLPVAGNSFKRDKAIAIEIPAVLADKKEKTICAELSVTATNGSTYTQDFQLLIPSSF